VVIGSGLYALATHAPTRTPLVIPPSGLDHLIPFVPSAALVYATYALLVPALIVVARHRPYFPEVFAVTMGCGLSNAVIYNLVPTRIAERVPAPEGSLLAVIQALDTPLGAAPSGHVALPVAMTVAALMIVRRTSEAASFWRRTAAAFGLWTVALAGSTLVTKQHVMLDIVTGVCFGLACAAVGVWAVVSSGHRRTRRRPAVHFPTAAALLLEWSLIASALAVALRWWNGPVISLAGIFIATRQHAILVLYHDGVHGLVARSRRLNDFIVNAAVGVPVLLPIHLYRALHMSHHAHLGAPCDPERVLLYRGQPWSFRPLAAGPLARQLAGDLFAWNGVVLAVRYLRERRSGTSLRLPRTRAYPELILQCVTFFGALAASFWIWPIATWHATLLWLVPYVTITQLLQKIRSFAEHTVETVDPSLSCSWAPGLLGRLTIWPYNINYHREHHARPSIPWDRLPAACPSVHQRPGRDLLAHLWRGAVP
jgi:fatty acid desaturase